MEERYTAQWARWFPEEFEKAGFQVEVLTGARLTQNIETGAFLDVESSNYYRLGQLEKIIRLFKEGKVEKNSVFFTYDFYHPGLEMVKYIADLKDIPVKIYAFCHAASYTYEDYISPLKSWSKWFEVAWWRMCDGIFVGSNYHKKAIYYRRLLPLLPRKEALKILGRIHVTGNPWRTSDVLAMVPSYTKKSTIIYPNRFDYEKRPNIFLDLCLILSDMLPDFNFEVVTSRRVLTNHPWLAKLLASVLRRCPRLTFSEVQTKAGYYRKIAEAHVSVSTSIEENFGYIVLESATFNTLPVVPNLGAYPETTQNDPRCLYSTYDEAIAKIVDATKTSSFNIRHYAERYDGSIRRIIDVIAK